MIEVLLLLILLLGIAALRNSKVREQQPGEEGTRVQIRRIRRSTSYAARLGRREALDD